MKFAISVLCATTVAFMASVVTVDARRAMTRRDHNSMMYDIYAQKPWIPVNRPPPSTPLIPPRRLITQFGEGMGY
ncbi:hypothetical protein BDF19DRAFT_434614 [Syncephalis fuscata]|nr:hypothetical protein BDF19DRAFT_434614 [Syncephalis fuscata]